MREPGKTLRSEEITEEVQKARTYPQPIQHYVICTTARKSAHAQDRVSEINVEHKQNGLFTVRLIFWEEIESYLDEHPDLAERLTVGSVASFRTAIREELGAVALPADVLRSLIAQAVTDGQQAGPGAVDAELARAKSLLDRHDSSAAAVILRELQTTSSDRFTPKQRFRCLSYLAVIEVHKGDDEAGARLFVQAADAFPEHELAAAHRAQSALLTGNIEAARSFSGEAFSKHPDSAQSAAVFVTCAPENVSADALRAKLSSAIVAHPEVACALAVRYLEEERYKEAIALATDAEAHPEYVHHALFIKGRALFEEAAPVDRRDSRPSRSHREQLARAVEALERAARTAEAVGDVRLAIQARAFELDATIAVQDDAGVEATIEEGLRISASALPNARSRFLLARSQLHTRRGDYTHACRDAERAVELDRAVDARAIYAVGLWNRNQGSDRIVARRELTRLIPEASGEILEQCVELLIRACMVASQWDEAHDALIAAEARELDSSTANAYRAQLARAQGRLDEAKHLAREAA